MATGKTGEGQEVRSDHGANGKRLYGLATWMIYSRRIIESHQDNHREADLGPNKREG
jgi:hypothetical protein